MNLKYSMIGLLSCLLVQMAFPQEPGSEAYSRAVKRNEQLGHNGRGFYADNLEDLVTSSDVVVRGRWGSLIRREIYYGKGVTREEMMRRVGATEETIETYGLPTAYYEIEIDEIIKGDELLVGAATLTTGRLESPETLDVVPWLKGFREGEHLFFMHATEEGEFLIPGQMFDMKQIGNGYFYRAEHGLVGITGQTTDADFLESVRNLSRE